MAIIVDERLLHRSSAGSEIRVDGTFNLGVYSTGGLVVDADQFGLTQINSIQITTDAGYIFDCRATKAGTAANIAAYEGGGGGAVGILSYANPYGTTIKHVAVPFGNPIYLGYDANGVYLECNMAIAAQDQILDFGSMGEKFVVKHNPAPAGSQVYGFNNGPGTAGLSSVNAPFGNTTVYLRGIHGGVIPITYSAVPNIVIVFDDNIGPTRMEANFSDASDHSITTLTNMTWLPTRSTTNIVYTGGGPAAEVADGSNLGTLGNLSFTVFGI